MRKYSCVKCGIDSGSGQCFALNQPKPICMLCFAGTGTRSEPHKGPVDCNGTLYSTDTEIRCSKCERVYVDRATERERCAKIILQRRKEWEDSDPTLDCPCYQKAAEMLTGLEKRLLYPLKKLTVHADGTQTITHVSEDAVEYEYLLRCVAKTYCHYTCPSDAEAEDVHEAICHDIRAKLGISKEN